MTEVDGPGSPTRNRKTRVSEELTALRKQGLAKTQRGKFKDDSTTVFRTPEEAQEYLNKARALQQQQQKAKPAPPTHLTTSDLNDWYSQQRQQELKTRKKTEEAKALLRGYKATYVEHKSSGVVSPPRKKKDNVSYHKYELDETGINAVSDEVDKFEQKPKQDENDAEGEGDGTGNASDQDENDPVENVENPEEEQEQVEKVEAESENDDNDVVDDDNDVDVDTNEGEEDPNNDNVEEKTEPEKVEAAAEEEEPLESESSEDSVNKTNNESPEEKPVLQEVEVEEEEKEEQPAEETVEDKTETETENKAEEDPAEGQAEEREPAEEPVETQKVEEPATEPEEEVDEKITHDIPAIVSEDEDEEDEDEEEDKENSDNVKEEEEDVNEDSEPMTSTQETVEDKAEETTTDKVEESGVSEVKKEGEEIEEIPTKDEAQTTNGEVEDSATIGEEWRSFISSEAGSKFPPEANRYHLYVAYACPWAHRTVMVRNLKGLEDVIAVTYVHPTWQFTKPGMDDHRGWVFGSSDETAASFSNTAGIGSFPANWGEEDPNMNATSIRELYEIAKDSTGKYILPVLWDDKLQTIVSNESSEIIRMFNFEFNDFAKNPDLDLYPETLENEINDVNRWVYPSLNNGVYKCGLASTQKAYDKAIDELTEAFDRINSILQSQRYLVGNTFTEADVRLFVTLLRYDEVYGVYFKANTRSVGTAPALLNYVREIYQMDGVTETCKMDMIKAHYYTSHVELNKYSIIPRGDNFLELLKQPHDRDSIP